MNLARSKARLAFSIILAEKGIPPEEPWRGLVYAKASCLARKLCPSPHHCSLSSQLCQQQFLLLSASATGIWDEESAEWENKGHKQSKPFRSSPGKFHVNHFQVLQSNWPNSHPQGAPILKRCKQENSAYFYLFFHA